MVLGERCQQLRFESLGRFSAHHDRVRGECFAGRIESERATAAEQPEPRLSRDRAVEVGSLEKVSPFEGLVPERLEQDRFGVTGGEGFEHPDDLHPEAPMSARMGLHDDTTGQRRARRRATQDETITTDSDHRLLEAQLHPPALPGLQSLGIQQAHASESFAGADEEIDLVVLLQRRRSVCEHPEFHIEERGRFQPAWHGQDIAALEVLDVDTRQIDSRAGPWQGALDFGPMALETADTRAQAAGQDLNFLADFEWTIAQRPGDDRSETGHREDAVDRQTRSSCCLVGRNGIEQRVDRCNEFR
ncbi:hypothetical protein HRbin27_01114 [bacterium HR27]|nr:hypothetical protein HRbin27_01114 [bacterium HR27]